MRFIKHLTTWLLLLTIFTASGVVSAKVTSGSQNLSGGRHQENLTANALMHLAKIDFSYDAASGYPIATKSVKNPVREAAKEQFRKESAGLERKVIRSGRDGSGKIVGVGTTTRKGSTYRPKGDGSYSVGMPKKIKHYRSDGAGGYTVNKR